MPPLSLPALVLFDMDDVLCTYDRGTRVVQLAQQAGLAAAAVHAAIWDSGFEQLGDSGDLDAEAYLRGFGERMGFPLSLEGWLAARQAAMWPRPEVLDLVRTVKRRTRVAVLTNNSTLVTEHLDRLFPGLRDVFGPAIFTSAGLGAAKPDVACFHRCLAALGVAPEDALFTDDLAENVEGAIRAGLSAHQYVSADGLARWLGSHGLV